MKRVRYLGVWLTAVFFWASSLAGTALAWDGQLLAAQKKAQKAPAKGKKKHGGDVKIEKEKPKAAEKPAKEELPAGPAKIQLPMVEEKKAVGATLEERLLDEEIAQLREIIQTSEEGPAKADLLFRLAERYYEKARSIYYQEMQDYDKVVEEWMKKRETNPDLPEPKIDNRKSQVYTKQAMDVYRIILDRYNEYPRRDEVLFTMGYNLYESGNKSEGVKMYWELIKNFPTSRFVPDAYLAMGEHYFNANDVFNAKKAYERALSFKDSKVYTYALYKLAWCDYNLGEYDAAIKKFKQVVELAEKEATGSEGEKGKIQLKREALQDMVLAFSQLDALEQAEEYYVNQLGKRGALEYMRKLARTYEQQGKAEMTQRAFRRLLNEYPNEPECPGWHVSILMAYFKLNQRPKVLQEVSRMLEQYRQGSEWYEVNKGNEMLLKRGRMQIESAIRDVVTSYHQEAQETKAWETYNLARQLYAKYLEAFGDVEYAYKLRWYYADVLYKMGDFYGAAGEYAKVVAADEKGPFVAEAAYNAVLCWDKCMEMRDRQGRDCRNWKPEATGGKVGQEEERVIKEEKIDFDKAQASTTKKMTKSDMEEMEIPFFENKFLEAADVYARVAPGHDMYIPIRFKSAFFFYRYRHYKEMARRFGEIIERYPTNEFAIKAVRLSLNSMYIKATSEELSEQERTEHWKEINRWAEAFMNNKVLMTSAAAKQQKFTDEIQSLIEESSYNVTLALRQTDPLKAAQGFAEFVNKYPKSKFAHRALYAALVVFDEANQLDLAIEAGKKLVKNYPDSDRFDQTLLGLADFHNRIADFAAAATYNEKFFQRWLKQSGQEDDKKKGRKKAPAKDKAKAAEPAITPEQARDALYNAGLLRESMGQYEKAINNFVEYIKYFPEAPDVQHVFYKVGLIYEQTGDLRKADRIWESYPEKYRDRSSPGRVLDVIYRHALALRKLGKEKDSDQLLDKILDAYNKLEEKARDADARRAAAHARFLQLEKEFDAYVAIKLVLPPSVLKKNLFAKIDLRPKLQKKYEEVVAYQDPDWAIASLVRMGMISKNLSQSMYDAPVPAGLTPDQQDIYQQELQNQALPLEEEAMGFFQKAVEVSSTKGIYNEWTLKAQDLIRAYQPQAYPPPFEADMVSTEFFYMQDFDTQPLPVPEQQESLPAAQQQEGV